MTLSFHRPAPATALPASLRRTGLVLALAALAWAPLNSQAQAVGSEPATAPTPTDPPSALDAPMFYQLLVGEMEAQAGRLDNAHEVMLDAARRLKDDALFQRAVELAVQARSGDRALAAAKAWRQTRPQSTDAARAQVQVLVALGRIAELGEPLRSLLQLVPAGDRASLITGLPRFLEGAQDKSAALAVADQALTPYLDDQATRTAARTALGRVALAADQPERALSLARRALADDPMAWPPVLLALEVVPQRPGAEALVQGALARDDAPPALRMAYARSLEQRQRVVEAIAQMKLALARQDDLPQAWLSLGAAQLDLRETADAEQSLARAQAQVADSFAELDENERLERQARLADFIHLLRAQAAEQRGDDAKVSDWLAKIPPERADLGVLSRRAGVMARQGRLTEARRLLREGAAADQPEPRARLLAEAQLLRNQQHWAEAHELLLGAMRAAPDDSGLIYELAMVSEHLKRFEDMEVLLRRVIQLKPDDAHAYNALGYSLVERQLRLDEAGTLIRKAVELAPFDPYIADSQGWLLFREGRLAEAERVLRQAWGARPHPEVAAHLGEVLWAQGRQDEARSLWRDGLARERDNEVLVETLQRLTGQRR